MLRCAKIFQVDILVKTLPVDFGHNSTPLILIIKVIHIRISLFVCKKIQFIINMYVYEYISDTDLTHFC